MQALKAQVRNGHFVIDESTDLPEGTEVELQLATVAGDWIVNLPERCVEVYTLPDGNAYAHVERFEPGQSIRLGAFPDVEVRVSAILE